MALIIGIVAVLIIIFGFLCYKKAPPTEAIVVTGFGLSKPKVVSGKGTFVLPVLQRADKLNMRLLKIDVKTPETGVKTQNGVSLWIDSVVTIQVYSENSTVLDDEVKASGLKDAKAYVMSRQQAAISNFLGMNEPKSHITSERVEDGWMFHEKDPITGEDKTSFRPDFTDEEKAIMDAHAKAAEKHATTNKTNPYKKKTGPNK